MIFLGIDPGLSGAIAFYDVGDGALEVFDMPTLTITRNNKMKRMLDMHQLYRLIKTKALATGIKLAVVEEVGAMPGQGVSSMFSFGLSAGATQMAVVASGVAMALITPAVWKRAMGVKSDKDSARQHASRLFPRYSYFWARKKDDGRAEAALLAYYIATKHHTEKEVI